MTPLHLETLLLGEVRHSLVTRLRILVTEEEGTGILVSLAVVACRRKSPRTLGVDFSQQFQIPLVADGEIISTVTEIETAVALITIGRHNETAAVALGEREESVWDTQRHRHIADHEIGGAEDDILAGAHLGSGERDVEVGMRIIAGGISAMLQIDDTRRISLRLHTGEESILLLGIYIINKGLLALEVELDGIGIIGIIAHLEDRFSLDASISHRVLGTAGSHIAFVQIHGDAVGGKIHVLVLHVRVSIEMRHLVVGIIYQRVVGLILYRCVDASRLLSVDTVESDTVIHHLIMFPYSLLQRVHLGGIGLRSDDFIAERIDKDGVAHSHGSGISLLLLVFSCRHTRVCNHHGSDGCKHQNSYS